MDGLEQLVRHPNWCYRWHLTWIVERREWHVTAKWGNKDPLEIVAVADTAIGAAKKALTRHGTKAA